MAKKTKEHLGIQIPKSNAQRQREYRYRRTLTEEAFKKLEKEHDELMKKIGHLEVPQQPRRKK